MKVIFNIEMLFAANLFLKMTHYCKTSCFSLYRQHQEICRNELSLIQC